MRSQTELSLQSLKSMPMPKTGWKKALWLEYQGYKCSTSGLLQVLLIAAARAVSLFAACRESGRCPDGPNDSQCLGGNVAGNDRIRTTAEPRLGCACAQALRRKSRMLAIDLTLIPYHGQAGAATKRKSFSANQIGHHPFPRLRHRGGSAQGLSLHLGDTHVEMANR